MIINARRIGKVDIAVLGQERALSIVKSAILRKQTLLVCFANAHTINMARKSGVFAKALRSGLILNDGIGVDIASRVLYHEPFTDNLNGTDFTPKLLSRLPPGTRLFLLGGPPGLAERAAQAILATQPQLKIAGYDHGYHTEADDEAIVRSIKLLASDLVLVAMGHPRQEIWAARYAELIGVPLICVGALLDFYAGNALRAPMWLRKIRFEWLYRLLREPRRLAGRYLIGNITFLAHIWHTSRREGPIDDVHKFGGRPFD